MSSTSHAAAPAEAPAEAAGFEPPGAKVEARRTRRFFHRIWDGFRLLWQSLSLIATVIMLVYQYLYPWGHQLPYGLSEPGAQAWLTALVLSFIYLVSRVPHFFGQDPGDWHGLVREVTYQIANLLMAVWFLAAAHAGLPHAPNAIGISIMLSIFFFLMIHVQIIQAILLTRRTWSDLQHSA